MSEKGLLSKGSGIKRCISDRWGGMGAQQKQRQSTLRVSSKSRVCGAPLRDDEFRPVLFEVPTESCREMKLSTRGGKCESDPGERWSGEEIGGNPHRGQ